MVANRADSRDFHGLSTDDLSTPLGQGKTGKRRFRLSFNAVHALAALLAVVLLAFAGFAVFNENPLGGEPMARVMIDKGGAPDTAAKAPAMAKAAPEAEQPVIVRQPQAAPAEQRTVTVSYTHLTLPTILRV